MCTTLSKKSFEGEQIAVITGGNEIKQYVLDSPGNPLRGNLIKGHTLSFYDILYTGPVVNRYQK
jgi:hypothetical protein